MSGPDFSARLSFAKDLPHEQTGTGAGGADSAGLDRAIATGSHVNADRAGEVRYRGAEFFDLHSGIVVHDLSASVPHLPSTVGDDVAPARDSSVQAGRVRSPGGGARLFVW